MEENKELDHFIGKIVHKSGLDSPSVDFTTQTLSKIELMGEMQPMVFKPIISNYTWAVIIWLVGVVFTYVIFNKSALEVNWLSILELNKLTAFNASLSIPTIRISNAYTYGCIGVAFFMSIQVLFLKRHFTKKALV